MERWPPRRVRRSGIFAFAMLVRTTAVSFPFNGERNKKKAETRAAAEASGTTEEKVDDVAGLDMGTPFQCVSRRRRHASSLFLNYKIKNKRESA